MDSLEKTINTVRQILDYRVASQSVYSANIANVDTPNYRAKVPTFEATLKQMEGGRSKSWDIGMRIRESSAPARQDGNNVISEQEMSSMTKNNILYMSAIQILNKEMAMAKYAITAGR